MVFNKDSVKAERKKRSFFRRIFKRWSCNRTIRRSQIYAMAKRKRESESGWEDEGGKTRVTPYQTQCYSPDKSGQSVVKGNCARVW